MTWPPQAPKVFIVSGRKTVFNRRFFSQILAACKAVNDLLKMAVNAEVHPINISAVEDMNLDDEFWPTKLPHIGDNIKQHEADDLMIACLAIYKMMEQYLTAWLKEDAQFNETPQITDLDTINTVCYDELDTALDIANIQEVWEEYILGIQNLVAQTE